jgi:ABC-type uncharacterized transport system substrate-binding protein
VAASNRLPAIYAFRFYATEGGLISYGIDTLDLFRRGASYIDRILKGDNPADLPVQAPTRFELVINLSTAKSLSLDVPLQLQQRSFRDMSSFGYAEFRVEHDRPGSWRKIARHWPNTAQNSL